MIKTRWLTIPFLMAFVILPRLSTDLYLPSLPNMGKYFQVNASLLQMTLTTFMFGYALSVLITGPLSDAFGRKKIALYGLLIYVLATFSCALSTSINTLIVARFFQALGGGCGTVIARVIVKDAYEKSQQIHILTYLSAAIGICPLFIPILGGTLDFYFGWRAVFYVLEAFAIGLIIFVFYQIQENPIKSVRIKLKDLMGHYKHLLTHRIFWGYSLAIGLAWSDYVAFTVESPFLLQQLMNLNSVIFGCLFALAVVGYLIGTQLTKRFANQLGWDKFIWIATLCCMSGSLIMFLLTMLFEPHWSMLIFPMLLIMIGVGIIIPCTQAAVLQPFPAIAGTASGLFFFIQMLFGGFCSLIIQLFSDHSMKTLSLFLLGISLFLVIGFYQVIRKHDIE